MSLRQIFPGGIVKPGFNPLAAQTSSVYYNLYSWGDNSYAQLGLGNTTTYSSPKQVGSLTDWSINSISNFGMSLHTAIVKGDGTLWTWGNNGSGQLGLGNRTYYSSPKQVGALTTWLKATVGYRTCFAIKTDGSLWSWGDDPNGFGILGLGNRTAYSSPKQVGSLTNWSDVVNGFRQTLAVKTDGTLWSWGDAYFGQLGLGNRTAYSSPKQVGSLTTWLKITTGYATVHGITTGGALWAWGDNIAGQLGLGNTTYSFSSPQQVGSLTNWSFISNGTGFSRGFSVAIKTDGSLWSWGPGQDGRLGLGNTTTYSSPKQIGALTTWEYVDAGNKHVMAVKTDGTLWTWGSNTFGQLGLGNTTDYSSPKQVGAYADWDRVAAGQYYSMALG